MAVTQGHGNPNWTEDEIVLALDLYFQMDGVVPGNSDARVIALSELLRSFPYHADAARKPSFRNPDGVAFKLQNLRQIATGKGLSNTSKADKAVWDAFGHDPAATRARAVAITKAIGFASQLPSPDDDDDGDGESFAEGRMATYAHRKRERNPKLRRKLIQSRRKSGTLHCDICAFTASGMPPDYADAAFEAHHIVPLSLAGESKTKLQDVALLCATCHRLVHRAIVLSRAWLSLDEARILITGGSASAS